MTRPLHPPSLRRAMTLVEMLIVIAVLCLLASLLLPQLKRAMESSRRVVCMSNLHQLYASVVVYTGDNTGFLPHGSDWNADLMTPEVHHNGQVATQDLSAVPHLLWMNDYLGIRIIKANYWSGAQWRMANPGPRAVLFCPSMKGSWEWPVGASTRYAFPASVVTEGLEYAYLLSGFGFFAPGRNFWSTHGVPMLDRMGGPDGPVALFHERYTGCYWTHMYSPVPHTTAGPFPGGNHAFAGVHVASERGEIRWVEGSAATMACGGYYQSLASACYTPGYYATNGSFPINRPKPAANDSAEDRRRIFGYTK